MSADKIVVNSLETSLMLMNIDEIAYAKRTVVWSMNGGERKRIVLLRGCLSLF